MNCGQVNNNRYSCAVLTISDRCSNKECDDKSGEIIKKTVLKYGGEVVQHEIVSDDKTLIKYKLLYFCDTLKVDLVLTTGGTGLGPRDVTPEATLQIAEKIVPGISELIRSEGFKRTKNAVLSRLVSVLRKDALIINLPGSPKGVKESLMCILEIIPHALDMIKGKGHPK